MDCREARDLLSGYYDDELPSRLWAEVDAHVSGCARCTAEFNTLRDLSAMAAGLDQPHPPAELWSELEGKLDEGASAEREAPSAPQPRLVAIAALLLVTAGIGWFAYQRWFSASEASPMLADFGRYLQQLQEDADRAQQILVDEYQGDAVSLADAARQLGFQPLIAAGLPEEYAVQKAYILKMPGCRCVQCLCRRDDGSVVAIFEHDEKQPTWFGDRPAISARCGGKTCSVVQVDDSLAVSWKANDRYLTVIGIRDVDELAPLIERLGD